MHVTNRPIAGKPQRRPVRIVKDNAAANNHSNVMAFSGLRSLVILFCAAFLASLAPPAFAQSSETKPADQQKAADVAKRRSDEIAEAARAMTGPAANPECVHLGERAVILMSQDDLDTAFRHLDLYDRFGCPGAHIQQSFRCLVKGGVPDAKATETLKARVHACWINPNAAPAAAAAPAPATAGTGAH